MAEFKKLPTQEELQKMLYMGQLQGKSNQEIIADNLASGSNIKALPDNFFQKIAKGAGIAKEQVNKLGNAADLARMFPGYTGESQVRIPTGYNFAPKQTPTGEVMPQGLQTQQVNVNQLLQAIKPADVLGITGAQQAYTDIGMGKAPSPMDVLDVAGLGVAGIGAGKGLLKAGLETGKYVAPKVGQIAEQYAANTGLLSPIVAYHGSTSPISELNPKKSFGKLNVSWVSPSPEFASKYATGKGGNVMPLDVNEGKVFDFADQKSLDKLTKKASNIKIYDPIRGSITLDKLVPDASGSYYTAEHPQLFNLIKKMGYDSVAVYENGVRNLGIFNPKKNIKSKFE